MKYPYLNDIPSSRDYIDSFSGLNKNHAVAENEFVDMKNMTGSLFPAVSTRPKRQTMPFIRETGNPETVAASDTFISVINNANDYYLFINGIREDMKLRKLKEGEIRQIVTMGAYVIVFPDKICYNTADKTFQPLEHTETFELSRTEDGSIDTQKTIRIRNCMEDGTIFGENGQGKYTSGKEEPANPATGDIWLDMSASPYVLKKYSTIYGWMAVANTYLQIAKKRVDHTPVLQFNRYDTVRISGLDLGQPELNGDFTVWNTGTIASEGGSTLDYIVIAGLTESDKMITQGTPTFSRVVPDMQFVTECGNRLWGCFYGKKDGKIVNEIYACKQGDPFNWHSYMGISGDSYAATVGYPGDFTGAAAYQNHPVFFKESRIYIVYGDRPANYQIEETVCRGVEKGSHQSICVIDDSLYYKSPSDICRFAGGTQVSISEKLGKELFRDAVAGSCDGKYYCSMKKGSGSVLYVYDTRKNFWHKEDDIRILCFASYGAYLYAVAETGFQQTDLIAFDPEAPVPDGYMIPHQTKPIPETAFDWFLETGDIGMNTPDMKAVTKLQIRYTAETGTVISIYAKYDSEGEWSMIYSLPAASRKQTAVVPLLNRRCDHLRLKIAGVGACKIHSISKTIHEGSEVTQT